MFSRINFSAIGMDLGDKYSVLCGIDQEGEVVMRKRLKSTPHDLEKWFSGIQPTTVAMEAGSMSQWISRVVNDCGHDVIVGNPLTILWIAIPLFIQTNLIFLLGYGLSKVLKLTYEDAGPSAMIGASNHFEVAIATATMLFGLSSGAALATVVGVLIEVPVMLMLVKICLGTKSWFPRAT